jgi:hypothetical protein
MARESETETATVTCTRCGATYPQGAVVCFSCGAPIGETSTPTQPIARVWAVPPPAPEPPAEDAVATAPRRTAPRRRARPQRPAAERRGRGWRVVGAILVTVLVVVGCTGSALGIRALLAAPPVPKQTLYQDPQHRFSFERPTLWVIKPAPDGVLVSDSSGTSTLHVAVTPASDGDTAQSYADMLASQQGLTAAPATQFAGVAWEQRSGQVTGRDGVVRAATIYVTLRSGQVYVITLSCPLATFESTNTLLYQPLLASFQFG